MPNRPVPTTPQSFVPQVLQPEYSEAVHNLGSLFEPIELDENAFSIPDDPLIELKNITPPRPQMIRQVMKGLWKAAEPINAQRGNVVIARGRGLPVGFTHRPDSVYNPQVRPSASGGFTTLPNDDGYATDWETFTKINRVSAVTFRGEVRSPHEIINQSNGFYPPSTRTDRYYVTHDIYDGFKSYMKRRYNRDIDDKAFLRVIDQNLITQEDQKLLANYMMWRRLMGKEEAHLGRMVDNQLLKAYISTTRNLSRSISFAKEQGWIYITKVFNGFVVPEGKSTIWGSEEMEIANLGPIPAEQIVGFVGVNDWRRIMPPFYIRPSFRQEQPEAFKLLFNQISAKHMLR